MKKLLAIIVTGLCVCLAFAQRNFWRGLTHFKKPAALETNIKSAVLRTEAALKLPVAPHIRITNLPGEPLVKLGGASDNASAVLPARMLTGAENYKYLYPGGGFFPPVYVPEALNTAEQSAFRGLKLYNLASVQNILRNGLEYTRVAGEMKHKIYFSGGVYRAAGYITSANPKYSSYNVLPTLVRFAVPENRSHLYARSTLWAFDYYYRGCNIPAGYIQDVMVFLEVNGTPGWYKVTLENGELVFTPAPSRMFESSELIEHEISIPETNIDFSW